MAKNTFQPRTLASKTFAASSLRGGVAGGAYSGAGLTYLAAKALARRPKPPRREEPELERPVAIVVRGEALFAMYVDGRGKVKRPAKPRQRKVATIPEAVYIPPLPPLPPLPIYCSGAAMLTAEVLIECASYDWDMIRREDLALLGVV